ncbi:Cloroperoxidase [Bimuria novae-zelandiae CBS 107.79]|uniref:Cloroperoxidase n=1 Tax=Bimuria novae-zelandiae CBS 107.79 TaxID=1447943 RepID=A0A6A5VHQ2_9PLEO|nr:Cloroperoxidase [Bimuria novae-zelandiae CBS 107.79]
MKLLTILLSLAAFTVAQSFDYGDWREPGPDDLRSPCPGLNALANHGFLPRDGRNITQATLIKGVAAVNLSAENAVGLFVAALRTSSDPASGAFTLQDLKKHNIIEHDGSLSRADVDTPGAGDQGFNPKVFSEYKSFFGGATQITLALAATARWGRINSARKTNPNFVYGPAQRFNSYAETATFFQVLQNATTGTVPLEFLEIFFSEERLPVVEGWRAPSTLTGLGVATTILQLAMDTDEKAADLVLPRSKRGYSHVGELEL